MNRIERKENIKLLKNAVQELEKIGYKEVKVAALEEYETPQGFSRAKDDEYFIPDITATIRGKKDYFDIALKTNKIRRLITKWRLMDTIARMKNRRFTLLVPRGSYRFTNDIISQYSINPQVIHI